MAGSGKRGGGDRVLESRHLVGLFLGVVLLCGVFFTLGYVMGRTQYGGSVHAESPIRNSGRTPVTATDAAAAATPAPEWDFYGKKNERADPSAPPKPAAEVPRVIAEQSVPAATRVKGPAVPPPRTAKGSIILQVAALSHQSDALAMASVLQQKRFASFVVSPSPGESFYRVQVGPYPTESAADAAKAALVHDGFKAIVKH